jgi:hypothetical protein
MSIEINLSEVNPTPRPRDAIHVAVVQVIAGQMDLKVGHRIYLSGNNRGFPVAYNWKPTSLVPSDGVVSPFIYMDRHFIQKGDTFWMIMNPSSVTDLRHAWSHPSIPEDPSVEADTYDDECRGCNG